ncbi:hypothetical protein DV736_g4071, partial [Chaetothyriales sp. CBS 134916]
MANEEAKPTLHHLSNSQSQRILWLLEELKIPYNLDAHLRQASGPARGRAPVELQKMHPLGKAPQLTTAEGRVISESSAIAQYLIWRYDTAGKFKSEEGGKNDWIRDEELCSLAGTTFQPTLVLDFIFLHTVKRSPFFVRPIFAAAHHQLQKLFVGPEVAKLCGYLNDQLGDQDYFLGSSPGRADFIVSWPIDFGTREGMVNLENYPKLQAWNDRRKSRPAWIRALEKGNGYLGPNMDLDHIG